MKIRLAEVEDIPVILSLLRQVGKVHHKARPDIFRSDAQKYCASQLISLMENPDTPIFVAEVDGKVQGYCFCIVRSYQLDPVLLDRTELYIDDLCVADTAQRQGIGRALFENACQYGKIRKCYHVTLNVWEGNDTALAFYKSCNMKPIKYSMETILEEEDAGKE